jgi:hypothetical protein
MLLFKQTMSCFIELAWISIASGSASWLLTSRTFPPRWLFSIPSQHELYRVTRTSPPIRLNSMAVNAGLGFGLPSLSAVRQLAKRRARSGSLYLGRRQHRKQGRLRHPAQPVDQPKMLPGVLVPRQRTQMVKVLAPLVLGDTTVLAHVVQLDPWHEQAVLLLPPFVVRVVIARDAATAASPTRRIPSRGQWSTTPGPQVVFTAITDRGASIAVR